jgi:CheY-like chemotaxis protein
VADSHQLEQVFLNIINNAADAMLEAAQGGTLFVRVLASNGQLNAEITDSGPGVSEPLRVFDPFYTTKPVGKGTGLGLSICYGIVKEHGGEITARTHPQGGAEFRVALLAGAAEPKAAAAAAPPAPIALEGRVLVVDDEPEVLEFERQALSGAGASVVAVDTPAEALARLERQSFDAVILDGKMPGSLSTLDVVQWIAANRPGLLASVLITVSSLDDAAIRKVVQGRNLASIAKPFQMAELLRAAHLVLSRARAESAS